MEEEGENKTTIQQISSYRFADLDGLWLGALARCCSCEIWRNQTDDSGYATLRPDAVLTFRNALVLRVEEKALETSLSTAIEEIAAKMHSSAAELFPKGHDTFPAIVASQTVNKILGVSIDNSGQFFTHEYRSYRIDTLDVRVEFLRDVFKIARWMAKFFFLENKVSLSVVLEVGTIWER